VNCVEGHLRHRHIHFWEAVEDLTPRVEVQCAEDKGVSRDQRQEIRGKSAAAREQRAKGKD
jgi:hypothetical protein